MKDDAKTCKGQPVGIAEKMPEPDPNELARQALSEIKQKFMIMSGKGGVGKTSVSVNLAIALADMGFKVGLMDVDIHGPDIPRVLGLTGMMGVDENKRIQPLWYSPNLAAVSIESLMPEKDTAVIWRGPVKHSAIRQFVGDVSWGSLDFLLIDAPPGTGDEPLTVAQLIKDAMAIIVTTPQEVALADVRKSISFCNTVGMRVFGLVENMSGYACPHCGKTADLFGAGGGERTAAAMGLTFLGRIPFDPRMVVCGDTGVSYQKDNGQSVVTRAFRDIAGAMGSLIKGPGTSTPSA